MRKHWPWRFYTVGCVLGGVLLGFVVVLALHSDISLQAILAAVPQNPFLTVGLLLLLYMLKSLTIFFPLLILEMAVGYLFPAPAALIINFLGIWIVLTIPYWIGRALGIRQVSKLTRRYPKFQTVMKKQHSHSFFLCFFLRVISCLPGDLVTMYLGATHTPFFHNLLGGTLGILPGMVLATVMGVGIQDPSSPAFWISAVLSVGLAALSTMLYYVYLTHQKRKGDHP